MNSDAYVELLITVVKPWITIVANSRLSVWQQDSPPCHTSGKSHKWLSANSMQLHQSQCLASDLNSMKYYVWDAVEKDINRRANATKVRFISRIKAVFVILPRDGVTSACFRFRGRIEAVIYANGGCFKSNLLTVV